VMRVERVKDHNLTLMGETLRTTNEWNGVFHTN